jgi:hypothetical protein
MRAAFVDMTRKLPFVIMTEENYETVLDNFVLDSQIERAYFEIYRQIGLTHGLVVGKSINKEIKNFNAFTFQNEYTRGLFDWVLKNAGDSITSVTNTYVSYIKDILAKGFSEGKTVIEMSKEIKEMVNRRNFYRWQALRIARTETTTAANNAAIIAGKTTSVVMDKVWISAIDARTRRTPPDRFDHVHMTLVKVPLGSDFNVSGELIAYPGAKTTKSGARTSGGNIINCRCTVSQTPRRDGNGKIVRI